jgi:hypothetical protein
MTRLSLWFIFITAVLCIVFCLFWDGRNAYRSVEQIAAAQSSLVEEACSGQETIDRWLLQQSWFYDEEFSELAGAFGQYSFSLYERDSSLNEMIEGVFCIDGNRLKVKYFESRFVPVTIDFSERTINFGQKFKVVGDDLFTVIELTEKMMLIEYASDGETHVFYRKS